MPDLAFTPARPAPAYANPGDLCVMACLFNIERENEKRVNFERFREPLDRAGIPLVVVECAFGDTTLTLGESPRALRVRAASALWQKERLLNAALPLVPARYTKIAWIDADILFENENWAVEASTRLNDVAVVQLAQSLIRLPRGVSEYSGDGFVWESFGSVYAREPNVMLRGNFALHGHTGFGWAARREVIEAAGLYDGCVAGGGDHMMAHAFCGDWESRCMTRMMGARTAWYQHAAQWASRVYPHVRARVGYVSGAALHLWHGELSSRRHMDRYRPLWDAGFDPARHLEADPQGCWRWRTINPSLVSGVGDYMEERRTESRAYPPARRSLAFAESGANLSLMGIEAAE